MKKLLLFIAIMSMTLTFAQEKQIDKVLDNSEKGVSTVYNDGKAVVQTIYSDAKKLSPKIESAIKSLATELKTTTDMLWVILVRQQLVWSIGFLILTLTSIFNWFLFYKRNLNIRLTEQDFVKGKKSIIDDILNPIYDNFYAKREEYKDDPRSQATIKGIIEGAEEEILIPIVNPNNNSFKYLHLIICLGLSGLSIYHFSDMLTGFINPEFGALKTIVQVASSLK